MPIYHLDVIEPTFPGYLVARNHLDHPEHERTIYVTNGGNDDHSGLSPGVPKATLQAATAAARALESEALAMVVCQDASVFDEDLVTEVDHVDYLLSCATVNGVRVRGHQTLVGRARGEVILGENCLFTSWACERGVETTAGTHQRTTLNITTLVGDLRLRGAGQIVITLTRHTGELVQEGENLSVVGFRNSEGLAAAAVTRPTLLTSTRSAFRTSGPGLSIPYGQPVAYHGSLRRVRGRQPAPALFDVPHGIASRPIDENDGEVLEHGFLTGVTAQGVQRRNDPGRRLHYDDEIYFRKVPAILAPDGQDADFNIDPSTVAITHWTADETQRSLERPVGRVSSTAGAPLQASIYFDFRGLV